MRRKLVLVGALGVGLALTGGASLEAQGPPPLMPVRPSGQAVSPVFEGWYRNPDGTYNLSFGYINRNSKEVVDIPVGPENSIEGNYTLVQGLPTHFEAWRHYGVMTVTVPADFTEDDVVTWTINFRGQKYSIPGQINWRYQIDALGSPAQTDRPAVVTVNNVQSKGPAGAIVGPLTASVGKPLAITASAVVEGDHPITFYFDKYSGPGDVTFDKDQVALETDGSATTNATFSEPGDYVVYVRANTGTPRQYTNSGQEQCCWTNEYVKVTVTP